MASSPKTSTTVTGTSQPAGREQPARPRLLTHHQAKYLAESIWGDGGTSAYRTNRTGAFYFGCSGHGGFVIDDRALTSEEREMLTAAGFKADQCWGVRGKDSRLVTVRHPHSQVRRPRPVMYCPGLGEYPDKNIPVWTLEEDCEWAAAYVFTGIRAPSAFSAGEDRLIAYARESLGRWYPQAAELDRAYRASRSVTAPDPGIGLQDALAAAADQAGLPGAREFLRLLGRDEENLAWRAMSFAEESSPDALRQRAGIIEVAVMAARLRYGDAVDAEETGLLAGYARVLRAQAADKEDPEGRVRRTAAHAAELRALARAVTSSAEARPGRCEGNLRLGPEKMMASMAASRLDEAADDLTMPGRTRASALARLAAARDAAAGKARPEHEGREVRLDGTLLAGLIEKHMNRLAGLLAPDAFEEEVKAMTDAPGSPGPVRPPAGPGPSRSRRNAGPGSRRRPGPAGGASPR